MKILHKKQKLKQSMTIKPPLQKILQGILHTEDESKQNERMGSIKPQQKKRQGIREQHRFSCTHSNPQTTKTTEWQESQHTYQY
jgi:hypothetical protein